MKKRTRTTPLPLTEDIGLVGYSADIPFNRLFLGVDNLRYDVYISPRFLKIASEFIFQLVLKHAGASEALQTRQKINWFQEIDLFKSACTEVMTDAINQAKARSEVQIDYLVQAALVKKLISEVGQQYETAISHFKSVIRKHEVDRRTETHLQLREEVFNIIQKRSRIIQNAGTELFDYFLAERRSLNELRALNFGQDALLADELFSNPLLHAGSRADDFFMMTRYVLLGYRLEDPLNYNTLIEIFRNLFSGARIEADRIIKNLKNMERLFNVFETRNKLQKEKQNRKTDKKRILKLRARAGLQGKMLMRVYRQMRQENLLNCIVAAYRVPAVIQDYCPPLSPQELLQFVVAPKARKNIIRKIKRFKKYTGRKISVFRLKKTRRLARVSRRQKKILLLRFLADFATYHRDLDNYYLFNETSDCINLVEDEKTIKLSRANNTLYEFMCAREQSAGKKPVIHHVVIKADVRGSTEIIDRMKAKGLNPASNFALNFFDPINKLLPRYGAQKIFIEGDAVILAIFEHQKEPEKWYGVARACGLCVQMIMGVKRYNEKNIKNGLPGLDVGIGISFSKGAPTFFYDEDSRIMISHSINEADRLSKCDRALRRNIKNNHQPFNVYLYRLDDSALESGKLPLNNPVLRYNVMGIELAPKAFAKLCREIHMKKFRGPVPSLAIETFTGYTGKFPTPAGNFQRLVIREAQIPEVSPSDFQVIRMTGKKYYEVCTHQAIYEHVKHL
ncbi:MAG: hypothetical protein K9J85_08285 [Desulfobacteraceae bacterium]|nr:hypothetical protein [Desulfobacteraceae bacterium]